MQTTKEEYKQRLKEVDLYFSTFHLLDKASCTLEGFDLNGEKTSLVIDTELIKIFKANGFILLYNLIEATIRNSITAVLNSISNEKVTYKKVTDELRKLWLKQEFKSYRDTNNVHSKVQSIMSEVLEDSLFTLNQECITISGNIDAQEIRNISKQIGCEEPKNGESLLQIKNKRNELAHGEKTFTEIGKNYTIQDLIKYKEETASFIENVMQKIEDYINQKHFLRNAKI
ncbi:MAG: hypothetical protein J1F38_10695 [Muribaculaceae bacterium]|nr:hypothetical protein [Muribaculaceae bacterium]